MPNGPSTRPSRNSIAAFNAIEDEYLKERRSDLHYVSARIFRNLQGKKHDDITKIKGNVIVVAHDLSPADTLQMNLKHVAGFVTDIGGKVSHTAILARSLGIPAVVGLECRHGPHQRGRPPDHRRRDRGGGDQSHGGGIQILSGTEAPDQIPGAGGH